jgi:hypothetical protein
MGQIHLLECGPLAPGRRWLVTGQRLGFGYRPTASVPARRELAAYREIIRLLLPFEEELVATLESAQRSVDTPRPPGRLLFLREKALTVSLLRKLPMRRSVRMAIRATLDEELARGEPVGEVHLYFETPCRQSCEFCEEPERRRRAVFRPVANLLQKQHDLGVDLVSIGAVDALLAYLDERHIPLTITGHDWTRHPRRDALLAALERHPSLRVRLQGPSLGLASEKLTQRIAALPALECVATTLQSSNAEEHDAMVGMRGAHAELLSALRNLRAAKIPVELALVLTRRALRTLSETLAWLVREQRSVLLNAFMPSTTARSGDALIAPFDEIRQTLEANEKAQTAVTSIIGVPHCAVPAELRARMASAPTSSARYPLIFPRPCHHCAARATCSGVPIRYVDVLGTRGIVALKR